MSGSPLKRRNFTFSKGSEAFGTINDAAVCQYGNPRMTPLIDWYID